MKASKRSKGKWRIVAGYIVSPRGLRMAEVMRDGYPYAERVCRLLNAEAAQRASAGRVLAEATIIVNEERRGSILLLPDSFPIGATRVRIVREGK